MNVENWSEFFAMGGYGFYVWGSYIVAFICIAGEVVLISKRRRTLMKQRGLIHGSTKKEIKNETTS